MPYMYTDEPKKIQFITSVGIIDQVISRVVQIDDKVYIFCQFDPSGPDPRFG